MELEMLTVHRNTNVSWKLACNFNFKLILRNLKEAEAPQRRTFNGSCLGVSREDYHKPLSILVTFFQLPFLVEFLNILLLKAKFLFDFNLSAVPLFIFPHSQSNFVSDT